MNQVKTGQVWVRDKIEYLVVESDPQIMVWSDPENNSSEDGVVWQGTKDNFCKEFSLKKS